MQNKKLTIFGKDEDQQVIEALKSFFSLFDYAIHDDSNDTSTEDLEGEILIYLDEVNYSTLAKSLISNSSPKFNSLNLIQMAIESTSITGLTIVTNKSNDYFPSLCMSPLAITDYFQKQRKPIIDESLKAIFKVFGDTPNHDIPDVRQYIPIGLMEDIGDEVKTVLIIDDHLCDRERAIGWFFMETLERYGTDEKIRFLFSSRPDDFFNKLYNNPVDIAYVDLDYSLWAESSDSSKAVSIEYIVEGLNRVGWRIVEKIMREHINGRITKNNFLSYEMLPQIVLFTMYNIEGMPEGIRVKEKSTPYILKDYSLGPENILHNKKYPQIRLFSCQKANADLFSRILKEGKVNDDIKLDKDNEDINNFNRAQMLMLRRILKRHTHADYIEVKIKNSTVRLDLCVADKGDIDNKLKDICDRAEEYRNSIIDDRESIIVENAKWEYSIRNEDPNPYKGISFFTKDSTERSIINKKISFCGVPLDNPILLAPSPLTAIQHYDDIKARLWYREKINMLLTTGVGGIILKTAYYNLEDHYNENKEKKAYTWIQDKSKTRVYCNPGEYLSNGKKIAKYYLPDTLYNTGDTKTENFNFNEMIDFVQEFADFQSDKIILSVGSKSYDPEIWDAIFSKLRKTQVANSLIEINARHTIREMLKDDDISEIFDEYIIFGKDYSAFYDKFKVWLQHIHNLASKEDIKKKLIIKLPFRSDLIHLLHMCDLQASRHPHYGIKGITLINTIKAPYPLTRNMIESEDGINRFEPGYIYPKEDVFGLPQLSGSALKYLRDWAIFQASRYVKNIDISASGGIHGIDDVNASLSMGAKTAQISTLVLLKGLEKVNEILKAEEILFMHPEVNLIAKKKYFHSRVAKVNRIICRRCGTCFKTYYCDAFKNKYSHNIREHVLNKIKEGNEPEFEVPISKPVPIIDEDLCVGCGLCAQVCPENAIELIERR